MRIQIVGPGCPSCKEAERSVFNACAELDLAADITHVKEAAGVRATPAVIVDGKVVISGRVPTVAELKKILKP
ncbi:MAG: thioredoxin family protein [Elusimicrobia bacterium]|nr:thioredoxin family protein [Elusimicrobiota bacterium]